MNKYTVTIVGGGVSGLSCALTLASTKGYQKLPQDISVLVIDDGNSDLKRAKLYNVPLAENGIEGTELLKKMEKQISGFGNTKTVNGNVIKVSGEKGNFSVLTEVEEFNSSYVVLATGFKKFEIEGDRFEIEEHKNVAKPDRVKLKTDEKNMIKGGLYSAGLVTGVPSMFASASGSGVQTACFILSDIQGRMTVIHDTPKTRETN